MMRSHRRTAKNKGEASAMTPQTRCPIKLTPVHIFSSGFQKQRRWAPWEWQDLKKKKRGGRDNGRRRWHEQGREKRNRSLSRFGLGKHEKKKTSPGQRRSRWTPRETSIGKTTDNISPKTALLIMGGKGNSRRILWAPQAMRGGYKRKNQNEEDA